MYSDSAAPLLSGLQSLRAIHSRPLSAHKLEFIEIERVIKNP